MGKSSKAKFENNCAKSTTLLSLIETVTSATLILEESIFQFPKNNSNRQFIEELAERLHISEPTAIIFSHILSTYIDDGEISLKEISNTLHIALSDYDKLIICLNELSEKGLIFRTNFYKKAMFFVGSDILTKICNNSSFEDTNLKTDTFGLSEHITKHFKALNDGYIDPAILGVYLRKLIEINFHLPVAKLIQNLNLTDEEIIIILSMYCHAIDGQYFSFNAFLVNIFPSQITRMKLKKQFLTGSSPLLISNIVKIEDGHFSTVDFLSFTENGLDKVFGEEKSLLNVKLASSEFAKVITSKDIVERKLFYNAEEDTSMLRLLKLLEEDKFLSLQTNLNNLGLQKGLAILLYGAPGTGKTESVLQLAKHTGRDLFKIDISTIRDKYIGESEKHTSKIFEDYRIRLKQTGRTPILFINEADALICSRTSVKSSADQMNNSMQNILLDEMDRFEGIMICTTNLETNPDPAFERRFLYKIKLSIPSIQVRTEILKARIPLLTTHQAHELSTRFELSGGQVDNIHRKLITEELIQGKKPQFDCIERLCMEEKIHGIGRQRMQVVGFRKNT